MCNLCLGRKFGEMYCIVALLKKNTGANFTGIILQSFAYFALRTYTGHAILKGMMLSVLDCLEVFHQLVSICLPKMLQQHSFYLSNMIWSERLS